MRLARSLGPSGGFRSPRPGRSWTRARACSSTRGTAACSTTRTLEAPPPCRLPRSSPPRWVAIKVMDPDVSTPAFRERFIREVELTSKLNHPHIVPILTATECLFVPSGPDGLCYYVMPYVEGESLRQRLAREKRLSPADALRVALEVADALSHAHAQGIIHRDIKPENILLSADHALVADFGIARAISAAGGRTLTGVGEQVGSPAYMSPEQFTGSRTVHVRTDIYRLTLCRSE